MCFAGLEALLASQPTDTTQVLAIFDNEETGSQTKQGAGSPFLSYMLKRIALAQGGTEEAYYQAAFLLWWLGGNGRKSKVGLEFRT